MTPKVVIFDLGKVFVDFDFGKSARGIAARASVTPDEVRRLIDHTPLLFRYETGRINREQFYAEICSLTKFRGDLAEFGEIFADIFTLSQPMVNLHAALRSNGTPTYILSNTNDLAIGHIRQRYPFFANFDGYIFSFEQGVMKPDAKIYEIAERKTGRRGAEILFVDDRPENLSPAAARGWQVVLQETPEKTRAALKALGLPV